MTQPEPATTATKLEPYISPFFDHFTEMLGTWGKNNPEIVGRLAKFEELIIWTKSRNKLFEKGFETKMLIYIRDLAIHATTGVAETTDPEQEL